VIRKNRIAHATCSIAWALFGGRGGGGTMPSGGQIFFAASTIFSCAFFFLLRFLFAAVAVSVAAITAPA